MTAKARGLALRIQLKEGEPNEKLRLTDIKTKKEGNMKGNRIILALSIFILAAYQTPAHAEVTASGSFTQSLPLMLPAGTQNLQPSLALSYSSSGGSGLIGIGWHLSGVSAISRSSDAQGVRFLASDNFRGPEGKLIDISGNKSLYHSENENWNKYEPQGSCGAAGPCQWLRTTKNGTKYFYGFTADSRIEARGKNGAIRLWALNRVEDIYGNFYQINYLEDSGTGSFQIRKITYTLGNGRSASQAKTVEFFYENRPDHRPINVQGVKVENAKRLQQIQIRSAGSLLLAYKLNY